MQKVETPAKETHESHLVVPSPEQLRVIAERQNAKEAEIKARRREEREEKERKDSVKSDAEAARRDAAAAVIQRNYRGYRTRRQLRGYGVDAGTRWMELMKEAKYHNKTAPMSRQQRASMSPNTSRAVKDRWKRAGAIATRAASDDTSESSDVEHISDPEEREKERRRKEEEREEMRRNAQGMGLEYFLEMVDHKHRYGSSLRRYHNEWKKLETNENFFYWLDYGEGKEVDLPDRPRNRLDFERVRYLSPEERKKYEVRIDGEGLLRWKKDDRLVSTSVDFRDSIDGIVPTDSDKPTWREVTTGVAPEPDYPSDSDDASSTISGISTGSAEDGSKYTNNELHDARGLAKLNHLGVDAVMNHMLRATTRKNTWIFCCDTKRRLYIGIKQSGAFQHSSFLRGAKVAAAGLIKVKRGQVRKLSPLSGHYAPPLRNFREFLKGLKGEGADLSRVSTGRSYAVLLGLEGYLGAKRRVEGVEQGVKDVVHPEEKRRREREAMDSSESAAREREVLAAQAKGTRRKSGLGRRFIERLGYGDLGKKKGGEDG